MSKGKISLSTAIIMNINMMVGAGIFIFPQFMAQEAGYLSFLSWPIVAAIFLPIVWSVAQASTLFPGEGSFYNYSKHSLGTSAGFISGWLYVLGYTAVACIHLITLQAILAQEAGIVTIGNHPLIFYGLFIALFCLLTTCRLDIVGTLIGTGTIFKLLPIALVCFLLLFYFAPPSMPTVSFSIGGIANTIPYALFGYFGFEACVSVSHRIKGSSRNAAKAIIIGFLATTLIYTIFNISLLHIMGPEQLASKGVRAFVSFLPFTSEVFQQFAVILIKSAIAMAHTTVFFGSLTMGSYLFYTMARENLIFFSAALRKTNRFKQPYIAAFTQGLIMFCLVVATAKTKVLVGIANLGIVTAYVLTLASLLRIHQKVGDMFNTIITLSGVAACIPLFYYSLQEVGSLYNIAPFFIIAAIGIIMFSIQRAAAKTSRQL